METPTPIEKPHYINEEKDLLNFNIQHSDNNFNFILYNIDNRKLKLICIKDNKKDIIPIKYEKKIGLEELKSQNKYFKMFDKFQEFEKNFIDLCKANNISIIDYNDDELKLNMNLMIVSDNIINITLKKVSFLDREKIEYLIKDSNSKDKKIEDLNTEIKEMKQLYDMKIYSLEKCIQDLLVQISNLNDNTHKRNLSMSASFSSSKTLTKTPSSLMSDDSLYGSNILLNKSEIDFILKNISNKKMSLKLLFSSESNGENVDDLKNAYSGKNDILFIIKTAKDKRFGGYAHESFKLTEFEKKDKKAFLFSLDKLKIYKSNNYCSIWKDSNTLNSINFGGGIDLKICHNFFSGENYTSPNNNLYYDYKDEIFALNGEKNFTISILEVFKVSK